MRELRAENLREAAAHFQLEGEPQAIDRNNQGHINDTEIITVSGCASKKRYVLQRINIDVFHRPEELMENVVGVTAFLRDRIREYGGDPARETLTVIPARDGRACYRDAEGNYWRAYDFIENTLCYDKPELPEQFGQSGELFGRFQNLLRDYPAETLYDTIPDFHNTAVRYRDFLAAVEQDPVGRAADVGEEIRFLTERFHYAEELQNTSMRRRVCHNDTKLSNVLFDKDSKKALCVIDLDTIMPGYVIMDFGDAIRFGASTAAEDEKDLDKVHFDKKLYDLFLAGFLKGCGDALTQEEIRMLPEGSKIITYEQALRFLGDYLLGDVYYKTDHATHNLERARTQIRLVGEMEQEFVHIFTIR
ncbi:phosphotransferase enzyme family protein [Lachnoclostridium sp. Marseille-P6806]|uniref:phosphotransferase enzyme family protein n=1 Tax=Lachnoclostridium sp. Marseille-P6806 TaxID=2364793 RepID=UPI001030E901|nr:aminoglycoside phosphotransferase family protein [Lachnoclostridium sp. Marseille-P6806]